MIMDLGYERERTTRRDHWRGTHRYIGGARRHECTSRGRRSSPGVCVLARPGATPLDRPGATTSYEFLKHTQPLLTKAGPRAETAARALALLCRNVLEKPGQLRYRRVPAQGKQFQERIGLIPGALEVLQRGIGFEKMTYPDGEYYCLRAVDASRVQDTQRELELFLQTATQLRMRRSAQEAAPSEDDHQNAVWEEPGEPVLAADVSEVEGVPQGPSDDASCASSRGCPPPPAAGPRRRSPAHDEMQRQLAARSIVHRVAARRQRDQQQRRMAGCLWAASAAGVAALMALLRLHMTRGVGSYSQTRTP